LEPDSDAELSAREKESSSHYRLGSHQGPDVIPFILNTRGNVEVARQIRHQFMESSGLPPSPHDRRHNVTSEQYLSFR
jgi:hypothetical protein